MSERVKSLLGKISQEALMILAIGLTVFVSLFAAWSSLAGQFDELRRAMYEGDARLLSAIHEGDNRLLAAIQEGENRLRQERREDMAALRNEMSELRREVRDDIRTMGQRIDRMGQRIDRLGQRIDRMGQRIDRLTESLIHAIPDLKLRLEAPGAGSEPLQKPGSEDRKP